MGNVNTLGGYNSFNAVFGSGDANTPSLLDLSEFPSLTNRSSGDNVPQPSPMPGAKPYVGMVKQPTSESSEFTMSSEDFPALPGTQVRDSTSPGGSTIVDKQNNGGGGDGSSTRENEKGSSKTGTTLSFEKFFFCFVSTNAGQLVLFFLTAVGLMSGIREIQSVIFLV